MTNNLSAHYKPIFSFASFKSLVDVALTSQRCSCYTRNCFYSDDLWDKIYEVVYASVKTFNMNEKFGSAILSSNAEHNNIQLTQSKKYVVLIVDFMSRYVEHRLSSWKSKPKKHKKKDQLLDIFKKMFTLFDYDLTLVIRVLLKQRAEEHCTDDLKEMFSFIFKNYLNLLNEVRIDNIEIYDLILLFFKKAIYFEKDKSIINSLTENAKTILPSKLPKCNQSNIAYKEILPTVPENKKAEGTM